MNIICAASCRFAVSAVIAVAVGCTRASTPSGPPHVLRIAYAGDPASLVPFVAIDQNIIALDTLFCQTLVGLSADNRDVPILVTRIPSRRNGDVSADGTQITYRLRPDAHFADGVPLTSADVAFTYRAIFDPRNRATSVEPYRRIASLRTPDPHTVVMRLRKPWNAAVHVLFAQADFAYGILPKHAFADTKVVGSPWENAPFGSGPFRVKTWLRGDRIVLAPNPYYRPRPRLAEIVLQIVPNLNSNFVALRAHAVDVGTLTAEDVAQAERLPGIRVLRIAENATRMLYLQTQAPPTRDVRVRRAIAHALDYHALSAAWRNEFPRATSFLPPPIVRWDSAAIPAYPHDPALARRELDAAGWAPRLGIRIKDGVPLGGLIGVNSEDPINVRIATLVQAQLAAVGMVLSIKANPTRIWFSPDGLLRNGKATIVGESWVGGGDAEQSLNLRCVQAVKGGDNHSFYCSSRFEALFEDQARTPSETRREQDFDAIAALVHGDVPIIPLYYEYRLIGLSDRVTGYRLNMLWMPVDAETWDVRT
ncbi:MAG: peptide ABC transporter substrate-binding protein [Candidatus Eremiobacteraeota bacterium]|nr:peptide ABC transporter substrate-binding protein [Candidatus Eremiobacteraeota bacterium]MBV8498092.1 peptide ABC transporter substrate-binding protein [Candidatus Eremiobacteraeota bacterium]